MRNLFALIAIAMLACGCRSHKEMAREAETHVDSIGVRHEERNERTEAAASRDKVVLSELIAEKAYGDTVLRYIVRNLEADRCAVENMRHVEEQRTDSTHAVKHEAVKEEKRTDASAASNPWWKSSIKWVSLAIIAVAVAAIARRRKNK